jgi:hypothetical protein
MSTPSVEMTRMISVESRSGRITRVHTATPTAARATIPASAAGNQPTASRTSTKTSTPTSPIPPWAKLTTPEPR